MDVPARVRFAVELLDPAPSDRVLEIGCGPGVAAALVAARLTTGRLLAIDRSAVAVRRTRGRCPGADVRQCALAELQVPDGSLDAAFSINVNLFWTRSPAAELALLRRALRAGGTVHICFGAAGPQTFDRVTLPIAGALRAARFSDVATRGGAGGIAVSATVAG